MVVKSFSSIFHSYASNWVVDIFSFFFITSPGCYYRIGSPRSCSLVVRIANLPFPHTLLVGTLLFLSFKQPFPLFHAFFSFIHSNLVFLILLIILLFNVFAFFSAFEFRPAFGNCGVGSVLLNFFQVTFFFRMKKKKTF